MKNRDGLKMSIIYSYEPWFFMFICSKGIGIRFWRPRNFIAMRKLGAGISSHKQSHLDGMKNVFSFLSNIGSNNAAVSPFTSTRSTVDTIVSEVISSAQSSQSQRVLLLILVMVLASRGEDKNWKLKSKQQLCKI